MAQCYCPIDRKTKNGEKVAVPCGNCEACVKNKISNWQFRIMQEEKHSQYCHWLTLTYDTTHIPITKNGFMTLDKSDFQLFMKTLRNAHNKIKWPHKIKYFVAGEYGSKTERPHFHIALFNAKIELIQDAWARGEIHYGKIEYASVAYTMKYMHKGKFKPKHKNDDRRREFRLMSKGLGIAYLSEKMKRWHKADLGGRMYVPAEDGKKYGMPRYYKDKIYNEYERKVASFHARNQAIMRESEERAKNPDYDKELDLARLASMQNRNKKDSRQGKL